MMLEEPSTEEDEMTLAELEKHILGAYAAETDHPIEGDRSVTVFMRTDNKKWFAATKNIGCKFVDVDRPGRIDILNVRLNPRIVKTLRAREGFKPAWNMNQNNWITVLLDGTVADDEILSLIDSAFNETGIKGRKR